MDAKRKAIPKSIRMTVYQKCNVIVLIADAAWNTKICK